MLRSLFTIILLLLAINIHSQIKEVSEDRSPIKISILTCAPGDLIYSLFGHSAVRVQSNGRDIVYNYGTFDFDEPGFILKFMRGKLRYFLSVTHFDRFMMEYNYYQRGVKEQVLNLSIQESKQLEAALATNALPSNKYYQYDFFYDNCSTRIRDILESIYPPISYGKRSKITYREQLHPYLVDSPWYRYGIDLIIGSPADKVADIRQQMFLPDFLYDAYEDASMRQGLVVKSSNQLTRFDQINNKSLSKLVSPAIVFSILLILALVLYLSGAFKALKWLKNTSYILLGLASLVIIFLWFFTDHQATNYNHNLMWISPVAFFLLMKNQSIKKNLLLLSIVITVLHWILSKAGVIPQYHPSSFMALYFTFIYFLDYMVQRRQKMKVKHLL